jgi:hypothetical protein
VLVMPGSACSTGRCIRLFNSLLALCNTAMAVSRTCSGLYSASTLHLMYSKGGDSAIFLRTLRQEYNVSLFALTYPPRVFARALSKASQAQGSCAVKKKKCVTRRGKACEWHDLRGFLTRHSMGEERGTFTRSAGHVVIAWSSRHRWLQPGRT